jgi:hypothetical protein
MAERPASSHQPIALLLDVLATPSEEIAGLVLRFARFLLRFLEEFLTVLGQERARL